ncbi:hypothetical protein BGX27_004895 [Mortierella sp. AM989]|nr:hypothetical protein BGX27_004895 [Mortierella sp. AM989]
MATLDSLPLLVVLNPKAGRKQGTEQFFKVIQPALERSGTPFRLIETAAAGHAQSYIKEFAQTLAVSKVEAVSAIYSEPIIATNITLRIMVVGGDGTVHEVVNGMIEGLVARSSVPFKPKIEFSIIPAGTGNAIATSLGVVSVQGALDRFLTGNSIPLQVIRVSKRSQGAVSSHSNSQDWEAQVYTVVVNSFGLHCATVQDAEGLRFLGNDRFRIAALKNILMLKQYEGRIDFYGSFQRYDRGLKEMVLSSDITTYVSSNSLSHTLTGPFTYLMLTKQSSLERGFLPTPLAKTSDEWIDILAVQNVDRRQILKVLGAAAKGGHHIHHEQVEYFKAKVVEFETPTNGRICIDGEFLDVEAGPQGRLRFEIALGSSVQIFHVFT